MELVFNNVAIFFLKTDSIIDIIVFLKACCKWTTEQNTRCFKKCKTKDLTQIAKNKIFAPSNNYKILGIVFAKTDLSKETKRDFKKRYILYEFQKQSFQGVSKKMSLKNFTKFTRKHLCWSLLLKKLQTWALQLC